ncbi:hypothetical protein LWI29_014945 [Acer saccharum]|uniref:C-JID domain-containing protein n=1 Tax=Acer saccharum TaxID=4024 RepID=A0AA39W2X2_ACESA|nr:hypothetical protein LWI29_014945 [Acer saccharum]
MILQWPEYPLRVLPSKFYPEKLFKLDLSGSNIEQLWEGTKHAPNLKLLFLRDCGRLTTIPNLSSFPSLEEGSEESPTEFTIFIPGSEIPNCFSYQSSGSSVNIPVLREALVNKKFMGFAICAVLGCQEFLRKLSAVVFCRFETFYETFYATPYDYPVETIFINSDHILLCYYSFSEFYSFSSSQNLEKLHAIANGSDYVDISLEISTFCPHCKVKCWAVYPIYAKPIEVIGATIEDIGETSRRKRDRSDDNEDQVEPHPKRICTTQPN